MSGPRLPALQPAESYSCHLADGEGRFNTTVPAVTVNIGTSYTCNITDRVPSYSGITAGRNDEYLLVCTSCGFLLCVRVYVCVCVCSDQRQFCQFTS